MYFIPRKIILAVNPTISPRIPPPKAITVSFRSTPYAIIFDESLATVLIFFFFSLTVIGMKIHSIFDFLNELSILFLYKS